MASSVNVSSTLACLVRISISFSSKESLHSASRCCSSSISFSFFYHSLRWMSEYTRRCSFLGASVGGSGENEHRAAFPPQWQLAHSEVPCTVTQCANGPSFCRQCLQATSTLVPTTCIRAASAFGSLLPIRSCSPDGDQRDLSPCLIINSCLAGS